MRLLREHNFDLTSISNKKYQQNQKKIQSQQLNITPALNTPLTPRI